MPTAVVQIQIRRGTLAQWVSANPTPLFGEICCIADPAFIPMQPIIFLGDGVSDFNTLYANSGNLFRVQKWFIDNILTEANHYTDVALTGEQAARVAADVSLTNQITAVVAVNVTQSTNITALGVALANEITNRQNADSDVLASAMAASDAVAANLNALILDWFGLATVKGSMVVYNPTNGYMDILPPGTDGQILSVDSSLDIGLKWIDPPAGGDVAAEEAARIAADEVLQDQIDQAESDIATLSGSLSSEAATRQSKDDSLEDSIASEIDIRGDADDALQAAIDAETAARIAADGILQDNIDQEGIDRIDADSALQTALAQEVGDRGSSDLLLQNQITTEASTRATADSTLQTNINTVSTNLTTEASTRATADAGKQPLNTYLSQIAALAPSNDNFIQLKSGVWVVRTPAQVKADLLLVKGDVGLGNVDNTSDAGKPVSTAQATAIALKENTITATTSADYYRGDKTFQTLNKTAVGLANVDNTSDATKPVSTDQAAAILGTKSAHEYRFSGRWYDTAVNATSLTSILVATTLVELMPFAVPFSTVFTDIACEINTTPGAALSTLWMGIYAVTGFATGNIVAAASSGALNAAAISTVTYTFPSPVTLAPGLYYLALTHNSATTIQFRGVPLGGMPTIGSATAGNTTSFGHLQATRASSGALLSTLGAYLTCVQSLTIGARLQLKVQ